MLNDYVDLTHLYLMLAVKVHINLLLHSQQFILLLQVQCFAQILVVAFVVLLTYVIIAVDHLEAVIMLLLLTCTQVRIHV